MSDVTFGMGSEYRFDMMACPTCGYLVDATSFVGEDGTDDHVPPMDGNVSICLACASISIFTDGVTRLRLPTVEERGEIVREPAVQVAAQAIIELRDRRPGWPRGGHER